MSKLATVQKNGSLANQDRFQDFPAWSLWIDNLFPNELPKLLMSDFNTGITPPKANIRETENAYFVDMAVPGMRKKDFLIELDNQVLSISSETKNEESTQEETMLRREFGYSSFKRTFNVPEFIDESGIKASYTNGILRVHLPKKEEAKQKPARTIQIS
jgi:HSP20 family protein